MSTTPTATSSAGLSNAQMDLISETEATVEPVAYIEHHKGGDNLTWERIDHPYAKATPLYKSAVMEETMRTALKRILDLTQHEPLGQLGNALSEIARAALKNAPPQGNEPHEGRAAQSAEPAVAAPDDKPHRLQRYSIETTSTGWQYTTTTDGLWVKAEDVEQLERELAEMKTHANNWMLTCRKLEDERDAAQSAKQEGATPRTDAHLAHLNLPDGRKYGIPNETMGLLRQLERELAYAQISITQLQVAYDGAEELATSLRSATAGMTSVPCQPSQALLESMALRYRHDFGLLSADKREPILRTMRQLYEEATGQGFFRG